MTAMKTIVKLIRDVEISPSLKLKSGTKGTIEHYCGNGYVIAIMEDNRFYSIPIDAIEAVEYYII
jgi:hypothetical protein